MLYMLPLEPWGSHRGDCRPRGRAGDEAISGWFVPISRAVADEKQAVDQNINEHKSYLGRCFPTALPGK